MGKSFSQYTKKTEGAYLLLIKEEHSLQLQVLSIKKDRLFFQWGAI
jgi:hypothetical protein